MTTTTHDRLLDELLRDADLSITVHGWDWMIRRELIEAQRELVILATAPPTCLVPYVEPTETFEERLVREHRARRAGTLQGTIDAALATINSAIASLSGLFCVCTPARGDLLAPVLDPRKL